MRTWKRLRVFLGGGALLALSGCFTSQQLIDFGRTELARTVADTFGQIFQIFVQGTA